MSETPKSSDQLPEEGPPEQVPDDVPEAGEGAARESAREGMRESGARPPAEDNRHSERSEHERSSEQEEIEAAAAEAARIGGVSGEPRYDPAEQPVREAGGGYAEGFEEAEAMLIEHASHGDQQSAHAILHDQGEPEEEVPGADGEADHERSTELIDEEQPRESP